MLGVDILRHYANVIFREPSRSDGLSWAQSRLLNQYLDENLDRNISLAGTSGRPAAQRVSLRAQIPHRIRLPAPHLRHAQAHRARQGPIGPAECSAQSRRRQRWLLGPEPHDLSLPAPGWRHPGRVSEDDNQSTSPGSKPVGDPAKFVQRKAQFPFKTQTVRSWFMTVARPKSLTNRAGRHETNGR